MTILLWTIGIIVWVGCGILTWGFFHGAHRQACYNYLPLDRTEIAWLVLSGPIGLLTVSTVDGITFWAWKPLTKQERWEIYRKKYPSLVSYYEQTIDNFDDRNG